MTFIESVKTVYSKYATFSGRATRSEFWWFILFYNLVCIAFVPLGLATQSDSIGLGLIGIFVVISFIPTIALWVRRLHDISKSGWWILVAFAPYIGGFVLLIFSLLPSDGENEYGPDPFAEDYA